MSTTDQPPLTVLVLSACIAVLLQLIVAPVATIFGIVPNFILVTVIIIAIRNNPVRSTVAGFVLGLIFDFCSMAPIGVMTLVLTVIGYFVSSLSKSVASGVIAIDVIIMLIAIVAGEFFVSVTYAVVGANPDFLLSLVRRVLPGIAYDALIGCILLLIYTSITGNQSSKFGGGSGTGTGRPLRRKLYM